MRAKIVVKLDVHEGTLLTAAKDAEDLEEEHRGTARGQLWGALADGLRAAAERGQKSLDGAGKVSHGAVVTIEGQKEGPEKETKV